MKTYPEALEFLYSTLPMFQRIGASAFKKDLSNTLAFCKHLGNPEHKFKTIHIAGTNGKGSTSHLLASILMESGYKTGLYTSPHLKDYRERIKVNGIITDEKFVTQFVIKNKNFILELKPSFFETTVAMAFEYFAQENVDIAVIETGMGGRLDSTNVITPLLSVITNIGFDHQQFLGNTLPLIAGEKAGIIKPKIPVVIGEQQEETKNVFIEKSKDLGSEIYFSKDFFKAHKYQLNIKNGTAKFEYIDLENDNLVKLESQLAGKYQVKNIATVLCCSKILNKNGFSINQESIKKGINKVVNNTGLRGRWETQNVAPYIVFDTAHNEDGLREALSHLSYYPYNKLRTVLGFADDKDVEKALRLFPQDAIFYFSKPDVPRGMSIEKLKSLTSHLPIKAYFFENLYQAFNKAKMDSNADDFIYIGGSTFVVAELI